ncbi:acyl-CoA thioesterase [Paracoccus jeotgali]|uniref:acyl-CoA thioesterase n=1 Tax=Paracoccus jeotgali TaxID=2065379 RepID=UPI00298EEF7E|nr:thioesterase family protein [Paracoccus jeotgali]
MALPTRWIDNDAFGHMNNAVHYQFFDTAVNRLLLDLGCSQAASGPNRFLVVETGCRYFNELAYPDLIVVGLRVGHLGRSSVRYDLGLFRSDDTLASAAGFLVHVNTVSGRPAAFSAELRDKLGNLM